MINLKRTNLEGSRDIMTLKDFENKWGTITEDLKNIKPGTLGYITKLESGRNIFTPFIYKGIAIEDDQSESTISAKFTKPSVNERVLNSNINPRNINKSTLRVTIINCDLLTEINYASYNIKEFNNLEKSSLAPIMRYLIELLKMFAFENIEYEKMQELINLDVSSNLIDGALKYIKYILDPHNV